ncbi:MAG: VCBS domain-containing protein, partial [Magnetococcus sp. YQC-5]
PDTQALTNNQSVNDSFTLRVTDGVATQTVDAVFAITGRNDTPTVKAGTATATLVEAGGVANTTTGTTSSSITLTRGDVDGVASHDTVWLASNGWSTANEGMTYAKTGIYGTVTLTLASGVVSYHLDDADTDTQGLTSGQSVTDSFTIRVTDGNTTQSVNAVFSITGGNDTPVGVNDTASAVEKGGNANAAAGHHATGNVLMNDTDVDATGATKTVIALRTGTEASGTGTLGTVGSALIGAYGSLTLNSDGSYSYFIDESNARVQALRVTGQQITDSFTYTLRDAESLTDTAELTISIDGRNDNPVGVNDTATATERGGVANATAGNNATGNVLTNDTDVDGEGETKSVISIRTGLKSAEAGTSGTVNAALIGTYGRLTMNADGTYTYVIDETNVQVQALRTTGQTLAEYFTYMVSDAGHLTDTAQLTITIKGSNDNPVGVDDTAIAIEAGGINNATAGNNATGNVLTNDTDADVEGETKSVTTIRTGLKNVEAGTSGTVGTSLNGSYGRLTMNADGTYTYVIDETNVQVQALRTTGQTLTEYFTYTVSDAGHLTDTAQLTITIDGRNDNPVGVDDTATAIEAGGINNATVGSSAKGNVLANDTDVDSTGENDVDSTGENDVDSTGETKSVSAIHTGDGKMGTLGATLSGIYGSLTMNADGTYEYAINDAHVDVQALRTNETLTETFVYTMQDAGGLAATAKLSIIIEGRNDTPILKTAIKDPSWSGPGPKEFQFPTDTFQDVDHDDTLHYSATLADLTKLPSWLVLNSDTRTFSGIPPFDSKVGQVIVTATDLSGASATVDFAIKINNPAPIPQPKTTIIQASVQTPVNTAQASTSTSSQTPVTYTPAPSNLTNISSSTVAPIVTFVTSSPPPTTLPAPSNALSQPSSSSTPSGVNQASGLSTGSVLSFNYAAIQPSSSVVKISAASTFAAPTSIVSAPMASPPVTPTPVVSAPMASPPVTPPPVAPSPVAPIPAAPVESSAPAPAVPASPLPSENTAPTAPVEAPAPATTPATQTQSQTAESVVPVPTVSTPTVSTPTPSTSEAAPANAGFQVAKAAAQSSSGQSGLFLAQGIPDVVAGGGGKIDFSVPSTAFSHTDGNATVQLSAQQVDGKALPTWLKFDAKTGKFSGDPPPGQGELVITVKATDSEGREATAIFHIKLGEQGPKEKDKNIEKDKTNDQHSTLDENKGGWLRVVKLTGKGDGVRVWNGKPAFSKQLASAGREGMHQRAAQLQRAAMQLANRHLA